jgi:hypothetical protein
MLMVRRLLSLIPWQSLKTANGDQRKARVSRAWSIIEQLEPRVKAQLNPQAQAQAFFPVTI